MSIKLTEEQRKRSMASIRRYVHHELDQEIGDLKAG